MDAIWNLTKTCPWNCTICCVSAIHVNAKNKNAIKLSQQKDGSELVFLEKLKVLEALIENGLDIDFSGGDPLYYEEDFRVIEQATKILPPEKISVSMTGSGKMNNEKIAILKKVGIVEFTLDNLPNTNNSFRPQGYNASSMMMMKQFVDFGIRVRAVTSLHRDTIAFSNLKSVHSWLCQNGIHEWAILKFCPTGRALELARFSPSEKEYLEVINFLRNLEDETLKISFHHPLGILENKRLCHAAIESIGILPNGEITACAWALDSQCHPFKEFRLGKLPEDDLGEMLYKAKTEYGYSDKAKTCRIDTYLKKLGKIL